MLCACEILFLLLFGRISGGEGRKKRGASQFLRVASGPARGGHHGRKKQILQVVNFLEGKALKSTAFVYGALKDLRQLHLPTSHPHQRQPE